MIHYKERGEHLFQKLIKSDSPSIVVSNGDGIKLYDEIYVYEKKGETTKQTGSYFIATVIAVTIDPPITGKGFSLIDLSISFMML